MHRTPVVAVVAAAAMTASACGGSTIHVLKDPSTTVNPPTTSALAAKLFADDFRDDLVAFLKPFVQP